MVLNMQLHTYTPASPYSQPPTPHVQAPTIPQPVAPSPTPIPVQAKLTSANHHPSAPAPTPAPTSSNAKYPGLPDYPHPQYEYNSVTMPTGPLYSRENFLGRISAEAGFDAATAAAGNPAVTVAVIDTGFALYHENLVDRWALNSAESGAEATDGLDNDNDGYIDNTRGWDFVHNTNTPAAGTDDTHGTAVSHGTLTAGLAGLLDPYDQVLPLQALDDNGSGYTDDVAAAVRYAADHGAKIISLSLGTSADDAYLHAQILYAIGKGAIVVAAAGNDGCNCMLYPAAYPEVLAVGSSTSSDTKASISSYGPNLDLLAPGTAGDVCSSQYTAANATTSYSCAYSGTSLATPIVAGLAALLMQECGCGFAPVTAALIIGADHIAGMNGAPRTDTAGYGRINVAGAVAALRHQVPQTFFPSSTLAGDFNSDDFVDVYDLSMLLGQLGAANPLADLNSDGAVDFLDVNLLISHWTG